MNFIFLVLLEINVRRKRKMCPNEQWNEHLIAILVQKAWTIGQKLAHMGHKQIADSLAMQCRCLKMDDEAVQFLFGGRCGNVMVQHPQAHKANIWC